MNSLLHAQLVLYRLSSAISLASSTRDEISTPNRGPCKAGRECCPLAGALGIYGNKLKA
ncbi:hypothetical protein M408DRAFT_327784 [Serendipita vermifera MAFF 305830]|uniref:Hydrophobin n=1 Tax=Serendipita vermifera MAFF 305830 TaxID=933852 RepID=A0A0C3BF98_SERVB|nr:hypothetical protein M408DRAFT_327784 [Serendipita vermifera MAFF 305830]